MNNLSDKIPQEFYQNNHRGSRSKDDVAKRDFNQSFGNQILESKLRIKFPVIQPGKEMVEAQT